MAGRDEERGLDQALLRVIAQRLGALGLVDSVAVFPPEKPSAIVAALDEQYFPPAFHQVFLEIRAFTNGDFSITYREESNGAAWQCRWDRHENPHSDRDHFHPPPQAGTDEAVDRDYPADVFAVLEVILSEVDDRLGQIWNEA